MTPLEQRLTFVYKGGKLKRFHARDTLTSQNIADHSFGVVWLVAMQYPDEAAPPRVQVLMAALAHDLGEHVAGDVPGDTKKRVPELKELMNKLEDEACEAVGLTFTLDEEEKRIVKFADLMEGLMFCIRERNLGSKACNEIWANYWKFAQDMQPGVRQLELLAIMQKMWEEAKHD